MNTMKVVREVLLIILLCVSVGFLGACSKKNGTSTTGGKEKDTTLASSAAEGEPSEEKAIDEMLNEVITRVRYGDKSGLYENEFEYFIDEKSFDEYLKMGEIRAAHADTITFIEIRHIEFFDHDSASVDVTVHFEGPTGKKSSLDDKLVVYYQNGRWIKPTVTVKDLQLDYEEKIRVSDSAAAAEAAEDE